MGFYRGLLAAMAVLAACLAGPAGAQENLDSGKSGAQLFASDCAICHKNAASLGKGGLSGLTGFLQEHYTASAQSAAIIAAYVQSVVGSQGPSRRSGTTKRSAKGDEKAKAGGKKSGAAASGETKSGKPAESKKTEGNKTEGKSSAPRPPETIPEQSKADAKPDKPAKSD